MYSSTSSWSPLAPSKGQIKMNKRSAEESVEKGDEKASWLSSRKRLHTGNKGDEEETPQRIWMNPDALSIECGICFMPFEDEVFMCNNGHAACAKCCARINPKCGCCDEPIGDLRCRPVENMLAEMYTHCKFSKDGCAETVRYIDKRRHEENCPYAACHCPVDGCSYRGTLLYKHVLANHEVSSVAYLQSCTVSTVTLWLQKSAPFLLFVQAGMKTVVLLLNGGGVPTGRCLSLVCLGHHNVEISYELEVRGSEPGTLSLVGTAPCIRQLEGFEAKKFLFVPDADWGPSGVVSVTVSYW